MFTILGATGNTGSVIAQALLAQGKQVRVLLRSAEKGLALKAKGAEVVQGDVTDPRSVAAALEGAEGAYFLVPPDPASKDLLGRGRAIVDGYVQALERHPVKHVVLLSSVGAELPSGTGPIQIVHHAEQALSKVRGTTFTFVRAAYFMDNLLAYAHPIQQDGVLPVFGGGEAHAFPLVSTKDIGAVAVAELLHPPAATQVIELMGPREYSMVEAAAEASAIVGREVKAVPVPLDRLVPTYTSMGVSQNVAGLYREMTAAMGTGAIRFEGTHRTVRGRVTLGEVLGALRG